MDFRQYVRAIRKSWWIIVGCIVLGVAASGLLLLRSTPKYESSVTFFVNTSTSGDSSLYQADQYAQQRVNTYVQLMSSERLAKMIISDTQLDISAPSLMREISAKSQLNTVILTADVVDTSPKQSLVIADALSKQFVKLVGAIDPKVQIEVTSGPILNPTPVSPRTKLDLALGGIVGLVLGILIAVCRELLDTTIRSATGLREVADAPVLGQIGYERAAQKSPLITDSHSRSVRAEAFRMLRTNLQFVNSDSPVRVITVTSARADEGKSTTSANLAIIFSETGLRVLLIEADLRRPRISDYLGLERTVGLSNVLAKQCSVDDVLQPWGRGGLTVLSSGSIPPNPSELLGSQSMASLLKELRSRFDLVIMDTPPLGLVTDAAVTAVKSDGTIVVVRSGRAKRQQVLAALESLNAVDARVLGCVLTMAKMRTTDAYLAYDVYAAREPDLDIERFQQRDPQLPMVQERTALQVESTNGAPASDPLGSADRVPPNVGADGEERAPETPRRTKH